MKAFLSLLIIASVILTLGSLESCYSDEYIIETEPIDTTRIVSFSNDIVPVFELKCNDSSCHASGAVEPDLTPANAYQSLLDGNFVDINSDPLDPGNSELYLWLVGAGGRLVMPPTGTDPDLNAKVLSWIFQGAMDN